MPGIDVFSGDAFTVISLTDAVSRVEFVPGRIGQLGIFEGRGVTTTRISIEDRGQELVLLPPTPRGGPGITVDKPKRTIRDFRIPHFEVNDAVLAEEVQDVRGFGSETATQTVMQQIALRIRDTHFPSHAWTEEHARMGAIKGVITYADASTLNLFTEFGVTQEAEIDFDLDNATPASGALRTKCHDTIRTMSDLLGGLTFKYIHCFCGDTFYNQLVAHPEVVASYTGSDQAAELRRSMVEGGGSSYGSFWFGGILFENYRGKDASGNAMVTATAAHLFPVGVPGLFRTIWAPADYTETVNTMGRRLYVKQYPMPNGKGVHLDSQQNAFHYCTRPKVLLKAKNT